MKSALFSRHAAKLPAALLLGAALALFLPVSAADNTAVGKNLTIKFCPACHFFEGMNQAGTVGPPFVAMQLRFPERKRLHDLIYNPQIAIKPYTMMPPFGRNGLLTNEQIEQIIDYLYTL
ncbi:MAG: sulfur oxidation c-type cytochrome SoxX [Gammaproteobacteria bacterium]|nr:sulfur oxidation c-type cytochrome SoxX [Gammaproteobacteria bacterium]